jgi:hypothetical protein
VRIWQDAYEHVFGQRLPTWRQVLENVEQTALRFRVRVTEGAAPESGALTPLVTMPA